ncbi:C13 family peptidase [Marinobacter salicampi]|uniref:C13 family peptidase n=1 Tax=Marinobacter salicampi TaxID=435907 RepID=UPI00140AB0E3|nr:C13 family peptidase [Marinobacter salicampi]
MKHARPRIAAMFLPLVATLMLTACDAGQLFPPDARLPDGSTYSGDVHEGLFHGEGVQAFASGMTYSGEFRDGYWHGEGELESPAGWRYEGEFRKGQMAGQGVLEDDDSRYEGAFQDENFHGKGRYEVSSGTYIAEFAGGDPVKGKHVTDYGTYEGDFQDWYYHGEGSFTYLDGPETTASLSGTWAYGQFVDGEEAEPEAAPAPLTEKILAEDHQRLASQVERLAPERPGLTDAYFLAVGGDGTESVFMRDIQVARTGLQARFDIEDRDILLLNHRDYETLPLATRPSIAAALKALDEQMNPEEDLLVVHLVSHGMQDGQLLLQQPGVELPNLSPRDFADMLEPLDVRRKVLVVSACYSGHWLNELRDSDTMILTSARDDRTSFGCGDDSEMTWFTKAVYQRVGLSFIEPEAMFENISRQIRSWEEETAMEEEHWSWPQYHLGDDLSAWLGKNVNQR